MTSFLLKIGFWGLLLFPSIALAQDPGDNFFSAWTVHEIRFHFDQPGFWDSLTLNYTTDQFMRADVTIDGMIYPLSGVKYKGNSSYNNPGNKKPFRIDLAEYTDDQAHDGLKKLVLNNGFKDPTFLREKLMLDFLNAHGIAAPRCGFAKLFVNEEFRGLYTVVEDVNKTFLEDRYGNKSGNLYKGDPKGTLVWKGENQSLYTADYELKTNETANDWSGLIRLIRVLNNTPAAQLPDSLPVYLDMDSWFNYWAAHNMFVNLDSYTGSGHNYFLYDNQTTGRFEWITWDVNEAFGNFQMGISLNNLKSLPIGHIPMPANQRPMMARLWTEQVFKQQLADHYCALFADFNNSNLDPQIDTLASLIRDAVYADPYKFFTYNQFEQNLSQDLNVNGGPGLSNIAGLKSFIAARHNSLAEQLSAWGCTVPAVEPDDVAWMYFRVFPNPAATVFYIQSGLNEAVRYKVFDMTGKLKLLGEGEQSLEIQAGQLPPGTYWLNVTGMESGRNKTYQIVRI